MQPIFDWFRENNDVFGFITATIVFLITIFLVSRKTIGFWMALLFLLFALFSGLMIANQDFFKKWMMKDKTPKTEAVKTSEETS